LVTADADLAVADAHDVFGAEASPVDAERTAGEPSSLAIGADVQVSTLRRDPVRPLQGFKLG
jgi:hypothetical protein